MSTPIQELQGATERMAAIAAEAVKTAEVANKAVEDLRLKLQTLTGDEARRRPLDTAPRRSTDTDVAPGTPSTASNEPAKKPRRPWIWTKARQASTRKATAARKASARTARLERERNAKTKHHRRSARAA
jgi:hypothetical protein